MHTAYTKFLVHSIQHVEAAGITFSALVRSLGCAPPGFSSHDTQEEIRTSTGRSPTNAGESNTAFALCAVPARSACIVPKAAERPGFISF